MAERPIAGADWTTEQWETYRAAQVAACARFGEPWATNVGRALVALADRQLARRRPA
jgi:hypothetical protein